MTHYISGFIGPEDKLKAQTKNLTNAKVIPLTQGMAFLPLWDGLYEEIYRDNVRPMKWLAKRLGEDNIVWVETDYFGGAGGQSAILWMNGNKQRFRYGYGSIDTALKRLGVVCEGESDEFDTLGLGNHRTNDSWAGK